MLLCKKNILSRSFIAIQGQLSDNLRTLIVRQAKSLKLPKNLQSLTCRQFSELPPSVKKLSFVPFSNSLPDEFDNVEYLKIEGHPYHTPTVNITSPSLLRLTLGNNFSSPIAKLPPNLLALSLGDSFDHPLPLLPSTLCELYFGKEFHQPVEKLPTSLRILSFGAAFNKPLKKLPKNLEYLKLGESFNYPLPTLPESLHTLIFTATPDNSIRFSHPIICPPNLRILELSGPEFKQPIKNIPPSLEILRIHPSYPLSLQHVPANVVVFTAPKIATTILEEQKKKYEFGLV